MEILNSLKQFLRYFQHQGFVDESPSIAINRVEKKICRVEGFEESEYQKPNNDNKPDNSHDERENVNSFIIAPAEKVQPDEGHAFYHEDQEKSENNAEFKERQNSLKKGRGSHFNIHVVLHYVVVLGGHLHFFLSSKHR